MLGDPTTSVDGFLLTYPKPTSTEVANFLKGFGGEERYAMAQELIQRGVPQKTVSAALTWLSTSENYRSSGVPAALKGALVLASASASAFHGYRRNQSIPWAIWWFAMGAIFPIITPAIGLAQGFGKRRAA